MAILPRTAAVLLLAAAALTGCGADRDAGAASSPSIEVEKGTVPSLEDATLFDAITALREAGLRYEISGEGYDTKEEAYNTREWQVVGQEPAAGEHAEPRDTVKLTVERP